MQNFLKYLLATILGIFIFFGILFFVLTGVMAAVFSRQEKSIDIRPKTILNLEMNRSIVDRCTNNPVITAGLNGIGIGREMGLNDILNNISKASRDTSILGIYLDLSGWQSAGVATVEEIRNMLLDFRKSGKFIVAYSNLYTQGSYYLASAADRIYVNPGGYIEFVGLNAEITFYKNAFDKLDLEPEIVRYGKFKSAVEPYISDRMSNENREQVKVYMGSIWDHIVGRIAESRHIPAEQLNTYADQLTMWNTASTIAENLVDATLYKDQVMDTLARLAGVGNAGDLRLVTHDEYLKVPNQRKHKGFVRDKIAVIYASGKIISGSRSGNYIASEDMSKVIREAREDSSVKAIVFRVNSGGGDAMASEVIWRELDLTRQVKPVIASMGDVAASGGYYILASADTIVASPLTLTGSIGVFFMSVNTGEFFRNKLGITFDGVKTNAYSDFGSFTRPLSATERNTIQLWVNNTYNTFIDHVAKGRGMSPLLVDQAGEGRVWSGINASENMLVDVLGGLRTAVELAAEKAGLEEYRIIELPEQEDLYTQIIKEFVTSAKTALIRQELGESFRFYESLQQITLSGGLQARLPFDMIVH